MQSANYSISQKTQWMNEIKSQYSGIDDVELEKWVNMYFSSPQIIQDIYDGYSIGVSLG